MGGPCWQFGLICRLWMIEVSFFCWHGVVLYLGQRNVGSLLEYTSVCLRHLIVTLDIVVYLGVIVLLFHS